MSKIPLGIFIPAYNEEKRLPKEEFISFLQNPSFDKSNYHLLFINDGSTDNTMALLQELMIMFPDNVRVHDFKQNQGKANAIREAVLTESNQYEFLGYLDADLATGLEEFYTMGLLALEKKKTILFGSRMKKLGSHIERKLSRHYLGRIFATAASSIIKTPIYDTQCGAKFFHSSLIPMAFGEKFMSKWLFDIEIIARILIDKGYDYFISNGFEYPLNTWLEKGDSKIKLKDMLAVPLELLSIKNKYAQALKQSKNNSNGIS